MRAAAPMREGTIHEFDSDVYAQAGMVLRELQGQESRGDEDYEARVTDRAVRPRRICAASQ